MSLEKPTIDFKLKALLASKTKEHLLKIINDYNEYCKANDLKDSMLKGYSKKPYNTKEGLINFLLENLSNEEKEGILSKIGTSYLEDLFKQAEEYIHGVAEREKIESIKLLDNGLKLKFKGWQWETETSLELSASRTLKNYNCTCRTGSMEGFCPHLFTGILILIKEQKFNPNTFIFEIPKSSLKQIQQLKIDIKKFEELELTNADIVLGDDYLISVNGNLVTMQWAGERAGKTTKDVIKEEKKPVSVKEWVAKKVVDKILAPLRDNPLPREIFKDKYGVIPVILENEKLVDKLLKKFIEKNEENDRKLPTNKEELEKFLKSKL